MVVLLSLNILCSILMIYMVILFLVMLGVRVVMICFFCKWFGGVVIEMCSVEGCLGGGLVVGY